MSSAILVRLLPLLFVFFSTQTSIPITPSESVNVTSPQAHFWCIYAYGPQGSWMLDCDHRQDGHCQNVYFTYEHKDYQSFMASEIDGGAYFRIFYQPNCQRMTNNFYIPDDAQINVGTFHFGGQRQDVIAHYGTRGICAGNYLNGPCT